VINIQNIEKKVLIMATHTPSVDETEVKSEDRTIVFDRLHRRVVNIGFALAGLILVACFFLMIMGY
jgi:hypothetical protein